MTFGNTRKKLNIIFRKLTVPFRILPDFIIYGAPRCGTTSLFNYLSEHPSIIPPYSKEVGYFEFNYKKGINWYKFYFPTIFSKYKIQDKFSKYFVTGEASATYIHNPKSTLRIKNTIPNVKLIVMLRNPVDRAFSQYFKIVKLGREKLSFEEAIEKEHCRLKGEEEKMLNTEKYSMNYHNYSYISAGIYINRLKILFDTFNRKQILIIRSEDFYNDPEKVYEETLSFLNLPKWKLTNYKKYNYYTDQPKMDSKLRKKLLEFYRPYNEKLYNLLGKDMKWDE